MRQPRPASQAKPDTREAILDATEQLILESGYAAVSSRRVAKKVGVTSALIHYYFPTSDELLVAVYRRAAEHTLARFRDALASETPLREFWSLCTDAKCTALAAEFMALANHREAVRIEIARSFTTLRGMQLEALSTMPSPGDNGELPDPFVATLLFTAVGRLLVAEKGIDITAGHDEAFAMMEDWLRQLEPSGEARASGDFDPTLGP